MTAETLEPGALPDVRVQRTVLGPRVTMIALHFTDETPVEMRAQILTEVQLVINRVTDIKHTPALLVEAPLAVIELDEPLPTLDTVDRALSQMTTSGYRLVLEKTTVCENSTLVGMAPRLV